MSILKVRPGSDTSPSLINLHVPSLSATISGADFLSEGPPSTVGPPRFCGGLGLVDTFSPLGGSSRFGGGSGLPRSTTLERGGGGDDGGGVPPDGGVLSSGGGFLPL